VQETGRYRLGDYTLAAVLFPLALPVLFVVRQRRGTDLTPIRYANDGGVREVPEASVENTFGTIGCGSGIVGIWPGVVRLEGEGYELVSF